MLNLNQLSSWLLDIGRQLWDCTFVPKRYAALLLFTIITFRGVTNAQFSCPDPSRCVSKDLEVVDAFIKGVDDCYQCKTGDKITGTLMVTIINKTGSTRTSFAVFANLSGGTFTPIGGSTAGTAVSFCNGPIPKKAATGPGTLTIAAGTVTFKCGDELKLTNVYEAWTDASNTTKNACATILDNKCAGIAPKCGTVSEIIIRTPLNVKEVSHTNVACYDGKTGSIDIDVTGGTPPYTYSWSNGATTQDISGLAAGDYTVTVTDAKGCKVTLKVTITQPTELKLSETHTNVACNGDHTGSINLSVSGGTPPYTYKWSNGAATEDISSLIAGDYTVTVTDANKCTKTLKVTITQPSAIKLTATITNVSCNGANNGSIDLKVSGGTPPYTYQWSNGPIIPFITGLAAGTYTVTVIDANKCTATLSFTITEPPAIKLTETHINVSCYGGSNGSIDLTVSGGIAPYTYLWSNGATTQDISGLKAGDYTVTVTDANKCTKTLKVSITQPPVVTCTLTAPTTLPICGSTGNKLTATTSVTGVTYEWSVTGTGWVITSGQGTGTITYTAGSNGTTATFTLKVTKDGCSSTCTVTFGCKPVAYNGCTPGFWKNTTTRWDQATDAVPACVAAAITAKGTGYSGNGTTGSSFEKTFGLTDAQMTAAGLPITLTLLQALNLGGGDCYALARHAVAALLNSCGLTTYTYTTSQVITMTHDAIVNKTCSATASKLAAANEAGSCPLSSDGNAGLITANKLAQPGVTTEEKNQLSVEATPNPFYTRIHFEILSPVSGQGQLDLYNVLGQKMGTAYQGYIEAGKSKTIEYSVPSALRTDLIYRMSVGTHSATGKLLQAPR